MREDFLQEEVICGHRVEAETKKLWAVELDLLETFMALCDAHGLRYMAVYGTLLGAVRHAGFIPWDDDIDMAMPRADYERLREIAPRELSHPYFLQTPENDPEFFSGSGIFKLRNSDTTYLPHKDYLRSYNRGCYIDILPIDALYQEGWRHRRQQRRLAFYRRLLAAHAAGAQRWPRQVPRAWRARWRLARLLGHGRLCRGLYRTCTAPASHGAALWGFAGSDTVRFPPVFFEATVRLPFEHLTVPVPRDWAAFVDAVWEAGMEMPDEEDRKPTHGGFIDTDTPFRDQEFYRYTDTFKHLEGEQRIVLFGAGNRFSVYMREQARRFPPACCVDNDPAKWGTAPLGVPVLPPSQLPRLVEEGARVIIANIYIEEISRQLREMGIEEFYVYLEGRKYE